MFRYLIVTLLVMGAFLTNWTAAQNVEFGFDGRVRTTGVPFNGNGLFKFAIVSKDGTICYWSNDGVTLTGNEPTTSVQIAVSNGFFSVTIGDTDIAGMAPLDAAIFNTDEKVRLRVWFNDGVNGFQQLNPDRPITNPSLIGLQSGNALTIYVDPANGNDRNGGTHSNKPKQTIQAAWDALPALISSTATIQLLNGNYRLPAVFTGKNTIGGAEILVNGNATSAALTCLTGAAAIDETSGVRQIGIELIKQHGVVFRNLQFKSFLFAGIVARDLSQITIDHCVFPNILRLGAQGYQSSLYVRNCDFGPAKLGTNENPISVSFSSYLDVRSSQFHNVWAGIYITRNSSLVVGGCTFRDLKVGVEAFACSTVTYALPVSSIQNAQIYGTLAESNSDLSYVTSLVTYSNVPTPFSLQSGSINIQN